ncbi:hypothetical protein B5M09_010497, partial [Aphanomyces astaci]
MDKTLSNIIGLPDQTPDVLDLDYPLVFAKEARKKKGKMSTEEPTTTAVCQSRRLAGGAPEFGLLDSERLLRKKPLATGLVPLEDDDGAEYRLQDGRGKLTGNTIVATITVATGGIREIQKAYEELTRGIEEQQRTASLLFFHQVNEDRARLLGVQESQLVEMAEGLLLAAETRQDEFQKALTYLRDCYTRELDVARAQVTNEANEALLREAEKNTLSWEDRTRELQGQLALKWEQREALLVRDMDSDLLVARRLHEEVLSQVQKDAERVLEVRRREDHLRLDGLMSSLREELRTLKRNHREEILLVREAARDEDTSKGVAYDPLQSHYDRDMASARDEVQSKASELESVQETLRSALRDLSFRESANVACGNFQILEKEKRDLREALREREHKEHRCLRESEETVRELQESILTEQNRYEKTLLSEQGRRQDLEQLVQEQFMTLTQERAQSG